MGYKGYLPQTLFGPFLNTLPQIELLENEHFDFNIS